MSPGKTTIIKNACVITGAGPVFESGYVHVSGTRIAGVGPMRSLPRLHHPDVIDAGGRYCLPGFINPHMHFYSALARGLGVGRMRTFGKVLKGLWWRLDRALSIEDVYVSALLSGIEAIKAGVTTIIDHHASYGAISGSLGAISKAMAMVGLRASLCFEISDRNGRRARDEAVAESGLWLESVANWCAEDPGFLQRAMVGLHASMTLSDSTLDAARELMDIYDSGAHVHVAEGVEDVGITRRRCGATPIARLVKRGILKEGSLAVHCVHAGARDLALLKGCGVYVVHNPFSNLNNAVGIAPVLKMSRMGIPVVIGTDGMSAGVADDIKLAAVLHKPLAGDAQAGWGEISGAVLKTAPRLAGEFFGVKLGAIERGAAADVIIIDAVPPTQVTAANFWGHILFGVLNTPVRTAIIAGSVRMRDFRIKGIDEGAVSRVARGLAKRLWKRLC